MVELANVALGVNDLTRSNGPRSARPGAGRSEKLTRRGLKLHSAGKIEEAASEYMRAIQIVPRNAEALHLLGVARLAQHRVNDALELLTLAVELVPNSPQYLANLGVALNAAQRPERAISVLDHAIALKPDFAEALSNRGMAYRALGQFDEAAASYEMAIRLKPDEAGFHFNLANALEEADRPHEALEAMQRAFSLRPDHQGAISGRVRLLETLRRYDDALSAAEAAAERMPASTLVLETLASVLGHTRNVSRAVKVHRRLLELDGSSGSALLGLSRVRRYAATDPELSVMKKVFTDPGASLHNRMLAGFAYGKALADIGDHGLSHDVFVEANALRRQEQPYSLSQARATIDRISGQFDKVRPVAPSQKEFGRHTSVFVVGLPRAGKTTIELLLTGSGAAWAAGELGYLKRTVTELLQPGPRPSGDAFSRLDLQNTNRDALLAGGRKYLEYVGALAPRGSVAVDTMGTNFMLVGLIRLMLPGARIVHAVRNPLEHAVALFEKPFRQPAYGYSALLPELQSYYLAYREMMSTWERLYPGEILNVDVDELNGSPSRVAQLFEFCGIDAAAPGAPIGESEPQVDEANGQARAMNRAIHADCYRDDLPLLAGQAWRDTAGAPSR